MRNIAATYASGSNLGWNLMSWLTVDYPNEHPKSSIEQKYQDSFGLVNTALLPFSLCFCPVLLVSTVTLTGNVKRHARQGCHGEAGLWNLPLAKVFRLLKSCWQASRSNLPADSAPLGASGNPTTRSKTTRSICRHRSRGVRCRSVQNKIPIRSDKGGHTYDIR
jgi:hypothetical protein